MVRTETRCDTSCLHVCARGGGCRGFGLRVCLGCKCAHQRWLKWLLLWHVLRQDGIHNRLSKFEYNAKSAALTLGSEEILLESTKRSSKVHTAGWLGFKPSDYYSKVRARFWTCFSIPFVHHRPLGSFMLLGQNYNKWAKLRERGEITRTSTQR